MTVLKMRVTGVDFAAGRLPEMSDGQFIRGAEQGCVAAVCATEQYQQRILANPANKDRLTAMNLQTHIEVMRHWLTSMFAEFMNAVEAKAMRH